VLTTWGASQGEYDWQTIHSPEEFGKVECRNEHERRGTLIDSNPEDP
jgi:hypothetical protein